MTVDLADKTLVVSISGGKDSAAMSLMLHEQGMDHLRVFADTGWEHEYTYEHLRGPLTDKLGPIDEVRADKQMEELCRSRGIFPSRKRRYCTEELKVFPIRDYIGRLQDEGHDVINVVGIRAGESAARAEMSEWDWNKEFDCWTWRPLLRWTEKDVVDIHRKHGLPLNKLYGMGADRVGCWPCIFSRKAEIRLIAEKDPKRIDRLRVLEDEVNQLCLAKIEAKGGDRVTTGRATAFFCVTIGGSRQYWPIDKVVEWSRTSRGGSQYEFFSPAPGEDGCMRWGLCETDSKNDPDPTQC